MSAPLDNFPDRHDFERGCMPDGSPLRFVSATLYEGWQAPIPGKSNIEAHARKQDAPENCGSIYTPEKDSIPITGVPCPVPDAPDAALEAKRAQCEREVDAFAYGRIARINNALMDVVELGIEATAVLNAHPELKFEEAAPRAVQHEENKPRAEQPEIDEEVDAGQTLASAQATMAELKEALAEAKQAGAETEAPEAVPKEPGRARSAGESARERKAGVTGRPGPTRLRIAQKSVAGIAARCHALIALMVRIGPRLVKLTHEQRELARQMIEHGHRQDLKSEFLQDRAVVLVKNMLLYCDDMFRDLGFGGWMPFRFPDQWLAFTSLMRKVLAANGLLCPKGPNHWRKFLEETPEVEEDKLQMPKSLAPTKKYAAVESVEEVIRLAKEKIELDPAARKRFNQRFAMGP